MERLIRLPEAGLIELLNLMLIESIPCGRYFLRHQRYDRGYKPVLLLALISWVSMLVARALFVTATKKLCGVSVTVVMAGQNSLL